MNIIISNGSPDPIYTQIEQQIKTAIMNGQLKEGDILSVRGHGRFLVDRFGNRTGKNRLHIIIKQYI